jgi:hypothetical protein
MDGADKSSQNPIRVARSSKAMERGRRRINRRGNAERDESRNGKMINENEQSANLAAGEESPEPLTEKEISRLKGVLEEKLARSHVRARWAGMVEDCEILLNHLESGTR